MKDKLEIVIKKLEDLVPYERNPRINDGAVKYVAESIKEFGFKVPIVIDKDNVIVCGHTRYKAAQELGLDEAPCIIADDLTDEQIKAFRIIDNKVAEKASWENTKLQNELTEINGIDMEALGFPAVDDLDFDFEETPEKEKEPKMLTCPLCGERFAKE